MGKRWVLHPGWVTRNRYVGEAEMRAAHQIPEDGTVVVLDGTHRRRFYGLPGDVHIHPDTRSRSPR